MKQFLCTIIVLFCAFSVKAQAYDGTDLTVVAISGLNLREKPDIKSKKLTALAFGTIVQAKGGYAGLQSSSAPIEIDGKLGHWIKVKHQRFEGYLFSAYVYRGIWVNPSLGNSEEEIRVLKEGYIGGSLNYSPNLNWYALFVDGKKAVLKRTNVTIVLHHDFIFENDDQWKPSFPFKVETDLDAKSVLLIGSKKPLAKLNFEIPNELIPQQNEEFEDQSLFGMPMVVGTDWEFVENSHSFRLKSEAISGEASNGNEIRKITCEISKQGGQPVAEINIGDAMGSGGQAGLRTQMEIPRLIFVGDLNGDQLLDFVFETYDNFEGCAGGDYLQLFTSKLGAKCEMNKRSESVMFMGDSNSVDFEFSEY